MSNESLKFYEAERKNIVITQEHISKNYDFDYETEIVELNEWLGFGENKIWEEKLVYSKTRKRNEVDTRIANDIFNLTYKHFSNKLDSVQMFDVITTYFDFDSVDYFNRLAQKYRGILTKDLAVRIGDFSIHKDIKIDKDKVQKSFSMLFNRK